MADMKLQEGVWFPKRTHPPSFLFSPHFHLHAPISKQCRNTPVGPVVKTVLSLKGCSVAKSCPTLCYPKDCSTPGFPVLHCLLEISHCKGMGSIPGWGTKIPHAVRCSQKIKTKQNKKTQQQQKSSPAVSILQDVKLYLDSSKRKLSRWWREGEQESRSSELLPTFSSNNPEFHEVLSSQTRFTPDPISEWDPMM